MLPQLALVSVIWFWATGATYAQELSYEDSIHALSYGNVALQGKSSGEIWLNVTGFQPDSLPYIQKDIGLLTLDNLEPLAAIAGLAQEAANKRQWGDLVFLSSAFEMNAFAEYVRASSEEMQEGLLVAVTGDSTTGANTTLIELYADTSSSAYLKEAFLKLHNASAATQSKRWLKEYCQRGHKAAKSACRDLVENLAGNITVKKGGPRDVCAAGCCISWSANATFEFRNLTNAANYCLSTCGSLKISCELTGVSLGGTIVDQCLSNRAKGCT